MDFHRARCVSSEWYSASESCTNSTTAWTVLFPREHAKINNDSCKLYDPHENKTYILKDLGFDLARSRCLASSGNWLLMLDQRTNFHLLNVFTRVRIPLPSLGSTGIEIGKAVLWVDEKSKDYLVVWNLDSFFAYHKKRDDNNSWKVFQPLKNKQGCIDMVLKESKLYVLSGLSETHNITVFDFSRDDCPVTCATFPSMGFDNYYYRKKLAVTLSGEVLIIVVGRQVKSFTVFKMDPKLSNWTMIESLGGAGLLLDLGITFAAKNMKNCIYFGDDQFDSCNGISVYHTRTKIVVPMWDHHLTTLLTKIFKDARWFFPTFDG